ncbi:MAG: Rpn family recombination-promoting nuclease/putative transposase, partial [Myxococcota bacterium]
MPHAPHDALFKTIFGQPEHAAAELKHILPEHVTTRLDWSSLALEPGSYVDEELADQHSDLLFSVHTHASREPALVYVLFEHQSSAEPRMALRLLRYMVRIWKRYADEHAETPLPLIIPAVVAHVPCGWTASTRFSDLFSASVADIAPGLLPDFQYAIDDLHHSTDADLRARTLANAARLSLWWLRDARNREALLRSLPSWASDLERLAQTTRGKDLLIVLLRYVARASRNLQLSEFRAILEGHAPTAEAVTVTIEEQLHAEGHA